jgi:diguanylate cyclase (GGDEF)-like protein
MVKFVSSFFRSFATGLKERRDFYDAFFLTLLSISVCYAAVTLQMFENISGVLRSYKYLQLDEMLISLPIISVFGVIYAIRRHRDMTNEIKRRRNAETNATWNADHDILTQLYNRSYVERKLAEIERERVPGTGRYIAFSINLNGFKKVNDLLGHKGGDDLLRVIAERLQTLFPGKLVARVGGDEFLVLSSIGDTFDDEKVAKSIARTIGQTVFVGNMQAQVGSCIGYAVFPDQCARLGDVIRFSDIAMNDAKRHGKNVVRQFDSKMDDALAQRALIELALREAIRNDVIVPFYQPLIDLETGQVRGFEALARWRMDDGRFIEPSVFIEMAEDAGLIAHLSESMLRRACSDAMSWPDHLTLAFNISPTQLTDHLLGLRIISILSETGLPAHRLEIEITESALVKEFDSASEIIGNLHAAGIRIALDDFGTGYSSLSQLSRFTFDKIKIDKSFINTFGTDEKQMKIVKTILSLGHGLGVKTTAEGIEDTGQMQDLKDLGCDFGQGYLFGKAVPAQAVGDLLAQYKGKVAAPQSRMTH